MYRSCTLLSCSKKGRVVLRFVELSSGDVNGNGTPLTWTVCGSGDVLCSKVDENENYALFGGKRVEVNVWDLEKRTKIWTAKSPPKNNLDIFTPTWFTSATFLNKDDHRKLVTGTNQHQLHLLIGILGVSMTSLTELSFNWLGFTSAMISNISFTYRSIYSKKAMTGMDSTNVYAYISIIALLFCLPPAILIEGPKLMQYGFQDAIAKGCLKNFVALCDMDQRFQIFLLVFSVQILSIASQDFAILQALKNQWKNTPPNWVGSDPCRGNWDGVEYSNSRVISMINWSAAWGYRKLIGIADIVDLAENQLTGTIPVSTRNSPGLDNLINTKHFHFGKNH
ncbi:hypothetical protein POM88_046236 [Heracleum sosnowskyi]|uniref:Uncharacterized protein n=1 Tax=Heracleum sosnowskyi TaxID=360622 RepID=A0AAD8H5X0_9APIA|nr:hypothetical protein POM88_046236 [Heracleum sosnowskyi]